jgi:hypothetical protein
MFVGAVWRQLALADLPRHGVLEALTNAERPGPVGSTQSLRTSFFQYYDDHATSVLLSSALEGLGYFALGWALTYLATATRARRPELPRPVVYLPLIAGVLQGLSTILSAVAAKIAISDFLAGPRTIDASLDIGSGGLSVFATLLLLPGALGLALALVLICLNAMRVGLLTRFLGVLGILVGALQILPLSGPLPIVKCFWLLLLGLLFLGRLPQGQPPAWRTGRAEPWPSSAELRGRRQAAATRARGEPVEPEPEPVAAGGPAPGPARKKRKRRR